MTFSFSYVFNMVFSDRAQRATGANLERPYANDGSKKTMIKHGLFQTQEGRHKHITRMILAS